MNEADKPAQLQQLDTAQDVELLLIQIANAIQRFISERNALRTQVENLGTRADPYASANGTNTRRL
jgi:hypothetical protein